MRREDGERGSLYSSLYMDDFNGVRRIVPCTNLNIDNIWNLESSRDLPENLQISVQAATEPQRSHNPGAKIFLNTNLQLAEAIASTSNSGSLNICTRPLIRHKHLPTIRVLETITSTWNTGSLNIRTRPLIYHKHLPMIRLSDDHVNLEYWQLERSYPSADPSLS